MPDIKPIKGKKKTWSRDREFLSKQKHEQKYAPKRKRPFKTYQKHKKE